MSFLVCCERQFLKSELLLNIVLKLFDIIKILLLPVDNDEIAEWYLEELEVTKYPDYLEAE